MNREQPSKIKSTLSDQDNGGTKDARFNPNFQILFHEKRPLHKTDLVGVINTDSNLKKVSIARRQITSGIVWCVR